MSEVEKSKIVVARKDFLKGLGLVKHALDKERSGRSILQGIYIHSNPDRSVNVVATNSFQLAIFSMPIIAVEGRFAAVFDPALILEVRKIAAENITINMPVPMGLGTGADVNGTKVGLIYGNYPDYSAIIPKELNSQATFDLKELRQALKDIDDAIGNSDKGLVRPLRVETKEPGVMKIWVERGGTWVDRKVFEREIPAKVKNPDKIAFEWGYFRQATAATNTLSFNGAKQPALFSSDKAGEYKEVVFPLFVFQP